MRTPTVLSLVLALLLTAGCVRRGPTRVSAEPVPPTPPRPAPETPLDERLSDGRGRTISASVLHRRAAKADVVVFGEIHRQEAGAKAQLALLEALAETGRPIALAMEFFERDVQADLDAYLAGSLSEDVFATKTRQGKGYAGSHRPLIELCKAKGYPVIAANAPRPLVTAFRKSDQDYAAWLAGRTPAERAQLPRTTTRPDDVYYQRFIKLMGPKRGPSFFRAQALWDDAMAEAVADFRDTHPDHLVLLIVGAFHVEGDGGTLTKIQSRRPKDRVYSITMSMTAKPGLPLVAESRGGADAFLIVRRPMPAEQVKPE